MLHFFLPSQASSLIIQHCPDLFSSIDEEVSLLQEEIASSEKVIIMLELEMQEAIKMKGKYILYNNSQRHSLHNLSRN